MSFAAPPDVIRWSPRSGDHGDCVVAALELSCGVSYEEALIASSHAAPNVLRMGMYWKEAIHAARRLGVRLRVVRAGRYDIAEATGILHVYQPRKLSTTSHVVYLWEGRVIEPRAQRRQLWRHPEQFLKHYGYRAGSLLVRADADEK